MAREREKGREWERKIEKEIGETVHERVSA